MKITHYKGLSGTYIDTFIKKPFMEHVIPTGSQSDRLTPAIIICPGGSYTTLCIEKEGSLPAHFFARNGIHAFILHYRFAPHKHPIPLFDAKQAICRLRAEHKKWNIDPEKIGCLGFSAGGHLVSTLGTHFNDEIHTADPTSRPSMNFQSSARPNFMILMYPVISMLKNQFAHMGSVNALLGENPPESLVRYLSSHLQVTPDTPPTLLEHGELDIAVPVQNSYLFRDALKQNNVNVELYTEKQQYHGYGLGQETRQRCLRWLHNIGILD